MPETYQFPDKCITPPSVTVYITNHNYGQYLEQSIQSVLNQTMSNFELIIIDDGSTDDSAAVIQKYIGVDKIAVIFQKNRGLTVSNNIALRKARGKYIMRLDADDYIDEHALEILFGVLERNADIGLVFPDYFIIDDDGDVIEIMRRHDFEKVTLLDRPAHGACTMIRKKCLEEIGGYDETIRCHDGYDLWFRFVRKFKIKNINLPLFYYRQHQSSLSKNHCLINTTRTQIMHNHFSLSEINFKTVAIIPVRGMKIDPGSEVLKHLGGKALIDWTIDAALEAKSVSNVILTTPDKDVQTHIKAKYGNKVIQIYRDPTMAMLNTHIEETLMGAIHVYGKDHDPPEAIVLLYTETPFRTGSDIDMVVHSLALFNTDIVVSVRPETNMLYQHNGNGLIPIRKNQILRLEREELYREAGQIRAVKVDYFKRHRTITQGVIGHVVIDQKSALRLNSQWDWNIAEFVANEINNKSVL
ncbi:MAG: glycosyltransferase [Desulfobacterales bacterium]|nr:glycosyltransferase [Desulfobacterales bacterium]